MTIIIEPVEDHSKYKINGKIIVQVSDLNWIAPNPFDSISEKEKHAFNLYKNLIIDNPRFKRHPRSTYKTHAVFKD